MTRKKLHSSERGIAFILFAGSLAVLIALLGLSIGLGSIFINESSIQNNANMAALAGLESYLRVEDVTNPPTQTQRISNAVDAVQSILNKNGILFFNDSMRAVEVWNGEGANVAPQSDSPYIQFGFWFSTPIDPALCASAPTPSACNCKDLIGEDGNPKSVPCFYPVAKDNIPTTKGINAVKVFVNTPAKSVFAPFTGHTVNYNSPTPDDSKITPRSSAIAQAAERCTVFLVDISISSYEMSHDFIWASWNEHNSDPSLNEYVIEAALHPTESNRFSLTPADGSYTLGEYSIPAPPSGNMSDYDCSTLPSIATSYQADDEPRLYWCAMGATRPVACSNPDTADSIPSCEKHYRSDYDVEDTILGYVAIDKFRPPEPFSSFMVAINAGLRTLEARSTAIDKIAVVPFSQVTHGPIPGNGLTRDLRFMIDMSDLRRAGRKVYDTATSSWITVGEQHPNFIDRGWFPISFPTEPNGYYPPTRTATNILKAFNDAIERLSDPLFCSEDARKSIVIATDGIFNLGYNKDISGNVDWDNPVKIIRWEGSTGNAYMENERFLLGQVDSNDILKRLQNNKIRVTSMLTGEVVEPNFINVQKSSSPLSFYDYIELSNQGYRGIPKVGSNPPEFALTNNDSVFPSPLPSHSIFSPGELCSASGSAFGADYLNFCALLLNQGFPGMKFRRPNGVFSQLSIMTQGYFCPLMEPYRDGSGDIDPDCYDSGSKYWKSGSGSCPRIDGTMQTMSTYGEELGGQAAECVRITLGSPPYSLVLEEPFLNSSSPPPSP